MSVAFKPLTLKEETFKRFISLLNTPTPRPIIFSRELGEDLYTGKNEHEPRQLLMSQVFREFGGDEHSFIIAFGPGKVGEYTFEDLFVRYAWSFELQSALNNVGGIDEIIADKIGAMKSQSDNEVASLSMTKPDLEKVASATKKVFGETGMHYLKGRLEELDKQWERELRTDRVQIGLAKGFEFDNSGHLLPVIPRIDWSVSPSQQARAVLDAGDVSRDIKDGLLCIAAHFLVNNHLARTTEASTDAKNCDQMAAYLEKMDREMKADAPK